MVILVVSVAGPEELVEDGEDEAVAGRDGDAGSNDS